MYRLMIQRQFVETQPGGFMSYFRTVALREWLHRSGMRTANRTVPLTVTDAGTGESIRAL